LDSWDGKLSRSLGRFARLRRLAPRDGDIMVAHARVLAWADRTAAAGALYDSVLARTPERTDALAGRARTGAWSGDRDRAAGRLASRFVRYRRCRLELRRWGADLRAPGRQGCSAGGAGCATARPRHRPGDHAADGGARAAPQARPLRGGRHRVQSGAVRRDR